MYHRQAWGSMRGTQIYNSHFNALLNLPCVELWADVANNANASKRNDGFYAKCIEGKYARFYGKQRNLRELLPHIDRIRVMNELLNQSYMTLDATDRVMLRGLLISRNDVTGTRRNACNKFYPQIFYGLWIPVDKRG